MWELGLASGVSIAAVEFAVAGWFVADTSVAEAVAGKTSSHETNVAAVVGAAAVVAEDDDRRALAGVSLVADEGGILEMATGKHLLVIAVGIELLGVGFDPHFHSVAVAAAGVSDPENPDECSMFSRV